MTLFFSVSLQVMYYAPWCGHCMSTKPDFQEAANLLKDTPHTFLAALDCTDYRGELTRSVCFCVTRKSIRHIVIVFRHGCPPVDACLASGLKFVSA